MTEPTQMQINVAESQEIPLAVVDEKMLPDLIQGQIGKLNELDAGVKTALQAASQAEKRAEDAGKLSAGWSLFGGKKKEAIEGLQEAGIQLAGAVQSGAKAQKISFEFQTRLADVTKYLFALGVGNIAANRAVVRELELRLSGASKEQLSELARQEVGSVIRQLKEQEDLLRKQDQMREGLREHDRKIRHLLDRTDDLGVQHDGLAGRLEAVCEASVTQGQEISVLQQQMQVHRAGLQGLTTALAQASAHAEDGRKSLVARSEDLETRLKEQDSQQRAIANLIESMAQASKQQQAAISTLQQQVVAQQAGLEKLVSALAQSRSAFNVRLAAVGVLATSFAVAAYFLH